MKIKKIIIFIMGITLAAIGTYINSKTNLGNSAVGSLPFVISYLTNIKLGTITYIIYSFIVLLEVLLAKKITIPILLQIPVAVLYGSLINIISSYISLNINNFYIALLFSILANTLIAIGMTSMIKSEVSCTPIEGLINIMNNKFKLKLGTCKSIVDITFLTLTIILGLIFKHTIIGVGLGTIIAVIYIGRCVNIVNKIYKKLGI